MITKLRKAWHEKRSNFWFVPAAIVLDAVALSDGSRAESGSVDTLLEAVKLLAK